MMLAFRFKAMLQSMKKSYLMLTLVCVFLGFSTVMANHSEVNGYILLLALVVALLGHLSVCAFSEYSDLKSTLAFEDHEERQQRYPRPGNRVNIVFMVAVLALIITILCGFFFIWKFGFGILPIGIIGILLIISYTNLVKKHPLYSLVAPGIGFGVLMVVGTEYVLVGQYTPLVWLIAAIPFFLINNLLLLEQYSHIDTDSELGNQYFPIAYSIKLSNYVYAVFAVIAVVLILAYVQLGYLPSLSLIALVPMPLAFYALYGGIKLGKNIAQKPKFLRSNLIVALATPALLGITLIIEL
jgi:1,4-dihydroxy-2-naphthoate octaprenyltransferase